ncbi:MAG: hypothetical protein M1820_007420 [Bogoriella megaspora]|nr:MAG: hypothetical protein M1820_007420 [Bogoriella megaspora]
MANFFALPKEWKTDPSKIGFLDLPLELRNEIYNYLIAPSEGGTKPLGGHKSCRTTTFSPKLLLLCRKVRKEFIQEICNFSNTGFVIKLKEKPCEATRLYDPEEGVEVVTAGPSKGLGPPWDFFPYIRRMTIKYSLEHDNLEVVETVKRLVGGNRKTPNLISFFMRLIIVLPVSIYWVARRIQFLCCLPVFQGAFIIAYCGPKALKESWNVTRGRDNRRDLKFDSIRFADFSFSSTLYPDQKSERYRAGTAEDEMIAKSFLSHIDERADKSDSCDGYEGAFWRRFRRGE